MEQRLRTYVDVQHRVGRAGGLQAELYAAEFHHVVGKLCARCQRIVGPQLFHGRLLLHFGKPFESVFHGLRREAVAVYLVDFLAAEHKVLHHEHSVGREEVQEGHFLVDKRSHFWHNLDALPLVARELALHLEGAD